LLKVFYDGEFTLEWDTAEVANIPGDFTIGMDLPDKLSALPFDIDMSITGSRHFDSGSYEIMLLQSFVDAAAGVTVSFRELTPDQQIGANTVTITKNFGVPDTWPYPPPGNVVLQHYWEIIPAGITSVPTLDIIFDYTDAEVEALGLAEDDMFLGFHDGEKWQPVNTQRDTTANKLWVTADHFSVWAAGAESSLPVELSSFVAIWDSDGIRLFWQAESQQQNLGWNLYRSETKDGRFVKVNGKLIEGAGTTAARMKYHFIDKDARRGKSYFYYLEDVSFDGVKCRTPLIKAIFANLSSWGAIKRLSLH
jgi:hypothetical protein